jgi:hypothetical protein
LRFLEYVCITFDQHSTPVDTSVFSRCVSVNLKPDPRVAAEMFYPLPFLRRPHIDLPSIVYIIHAYAVGISLGINSANSPQQIVKEKLLLSTAESGSHNVSLGAA